MADNNTIMTELSRVLAGRADSPASAGSAVSLLSSGTAAETAGRNSLTEAIAQNTAQLMQVRGSIQSQLESLLENTRALVENTSKAQSGGSKVGSVATSVASSIFGGGLLGPIISGLVGLFGGHDEPAATESLVKFALPEAVRVDAAVQGGTAGTVSYGQNDVPRMTQQTATAPQITVNVSAMDSRSFLDHSGEIASAVKRALLESNSLGDVIGDM